MSTRLYLANTIAQMLPQSRMFRAKAALYHWAGIDIHRSARVISSARLWGVGRISIGEETFIGHDVLILTGNNKICIGNHVDIGPRVTLVNGTHEIDMIGLRTAGRGRSDEIIIRNGVWIGAGSVVIGGCCIGEKSLIGAGSVVVTDIPDWVIAVGNPCRPIKRWDTVLSTWRPL